MTVQSKLYILVINIGSSSLKFTLFHAASIELECSGLISRIGEEKSRIEIKDSKNRMILSQSEAINNTVAALQQLLKWIKENASSYRLVAIGHRVVQGGPIYRQPELITDKLIKTLKTFVYLAPNHLPDELNAIRIFQTAYPTLPQIACFDTSFHKDMPPYVKYYPLPSTFINKGLIKYGFHGLSYEYILHKLTINKSTIGKKKIIIAHLGNGSSMTAIVNGISVDTTMGISPIGGLVMGTRCGDLDPGVLLYLLKQEKLRPAQLDDLLSKHSGLLALSGSSDVQELLSAEANDDEKAAKALKVFCYQAKKFIGALAAAMEGLDMLVFTGGIGENSATIRKRICSGLGFIGLEIDNTSNQGMKENISSKGSRINVKVIRTNEEWMIAKHTQHMIQTNLN